MVALMRSRDVAARQPVAVRTVKNVRVGPSVNAGSTPSQACEATPQPVVSACALIEQLSSWILGPIDVPGVEDQRHCAHLVRPIARGLPGFQARGPLRSPACGAGAREHVIRRGVSAQAGRLHRGRHRRGRSIRGLAAIPELARSQADAIAKPKLRRARRSLARSEYLRPNGSLDGSPFGALADGRRSIGGRDVFRRVAGAVAPVFRIGRIGVERTGEGRLGAMADVFADQAGRRLAALDPILDGAQPVDFQGADAAGTAVHPRDQEQAEEVLGGLAPGHRALDGLVVVDHRSRRIGRICPAVIDDQLPGRRLEPTQVRIAVIVVGGEVEVIVIALEIEIRGLVALAGEPGLAVEEIVDQRVQRLLGLPAKFRADQQAAG